MSIPIVVAAAGVAFILALFSTALWIRIAPRFHLLDVPAGRKEHKSPTPTAGGIAVFVSFSIGYCLLASFASTFRPDWSLLVASSMLVLVGLLDDRFSLSWQSRLLVQCLLAVAVVLRGGNTDLMQFLAGLAWIVVLTNAFNMVDNMDALAAGTAEIVALAFLAIALLTGYDSGVVVPGLLFAGAVAGFLWFNLPPAQVFMGDAGSTFLGFFLATISWQNFVSQSWQLALAAVCVCGVLWYDCLTVTGLRLKQGKSPFQGDRQHISHRFLTRGCHSVQAVRYVHGLAALSAVTGILISCSSPTMAWPLFAGAFLGWFGFGMWDFVSYCRSLRAG
ncbi:MAG: undecaprenyl-phosphate alpha-N-acetylglucosaminyl 1-phosphate transferase [Gemmatales bacterium]|nr:MAG: undecaprenyl-phosphate alpha-N-acetylglucosaminyl 1-phosphate transferase [Gemmatales bacterium]